MVAGHGTLDHPRNGYAEVRALLRLHDNMPIPSGAAFEVTPNLVDITASAHVTEAATLHESPSLPFSEDWQKSVCNFRLLRYEIGDGTQLVDREIIQKCRDAWLTSADSRDPEEGIVTLGPSTVQFAEIAAKWSTTLDCEACQERVLFSTMSAAAQAVKTLASGLTFAIGMPYSPLPAQDFRAVNVAWLRDFTLDGNLHADHGIWPANQADPRQFLLERFPSLEVQDSHYEDFADVLSARNTHMEIGRYHALLSTAYQALYLEGNASACTLMCGQACEILFDLTALHLRWWDRETPESTAALLRDPITRRVGRDYARLGGNWDPYKGTGSGPLARECSGRTESHCTWRPRCHLCRGGSRA